MKTAIVPSSWVRRDGLRFDAGPYTSGALEARMRLAELGVPKDLLAALTTGHNGGIFNGPQFGRNWVDTPEFGVPFLGSSSMLLADLSNVPLLRRRDAESSKLSYLRITPGTTLISCSGTIGRMVYTRPDMDGMWTSQDIMKVVPDPDRIPPGYLYAFLSGKFGVPLVTSSTYGAIIPHIEPPHLANLPVPRIGHQLEQAVHDLVERAAQSRSLASRMISSADTALTRSLGLPDLKAKSVSQKSTSVVNFSALNDRLDGQYHSTAALQVDADFRNGKFGQRRLSDAVEHSFKPPIFKRIWVDDASYGAQFISGSDAYRHKEDQPRYVSSRTPKFEDFILKRGMIIFQAAGQISGLFGRPLLVSGWLEGIFAADDLYRLVPKTLEDTGYLFGVLRTPHGQVALKRQASGNSIPRIWDPHIRDIFIPWPDDKTRAELAYGYLIAHQLLDEARKAEETAVKLVEQTIEEAALWRR